MDNQTFFTSALEHLRKQRQAALRFHGDVENDGFTVHWAYRDSASPHALMSAVGLHIPADVYVEAMEDFEPTELIAEFPAVAEILAGMDPALMDAVEEAQRSHHGQPSEDRMMEIAAQFGVEYPPALERAILFTLPDHPTGSKLREATGQPG